MVSDDRSRPGIVACEFRMFVGGILIRYFLADVCQQFVDLSGSQIGLKPLQSDPNHIAVVELMSKSEFGNLPPETVEEFHILRP